MARKPNYNFEKRRKELDRKAKRDARREERRERKEEGTTGGGAPIGTIEQGDLVIGVPEDRIPADE
jgi:hypothetical protein